MPDWKTLQIDATAIEDHIEELGRIGALPGGGLYRGLYDPNWKAAVDLLRRWMDELGISTRLDSVGNLLGRIEGTASPRTVMSGSHVDTVKQGGRYDGALGILAALFATKALLETFGPPRKAMEVLATCEEEGSRFRTNFWGARALCGQIRSGEAENVADSEGVSLAMAMRAIGFDPARTRDATRDDVDAFVELHIEQGRVLEEGGYALGLVDVITGLRQLRVELVGRPDHAGTTPMDLRRDALVGAAEVITRITEIVVAMGRPAVATVGSLDVSPGARNIVPGMVAFTLDLRHPDSTSRQKLVAVADQVVRETATRRGLEVGIEQLTDHEPVVLDRRLRSILEAAAGEEGLSYLVMPSGAGHDSQILAQRFPAAMLFVPSRNGRSHSPEEYTPIDQIVPGVRVLARTLYHLAYEEV